MVRSGYLDFGRWWQKSCDVSVHFVHHFFQPVMNILYILCTQSCTSVMRFPFLASLCSVQVRVSKCQIITNHQTVEIAVGMRPMVMVENHKNGNRNGSKWELIALSRRSGHLGNRIPGHLINQNSAKLNWISKNQKDAFISKKTATHRPNLGYTLVFICAVWLRHCVSRSKKKKKKRRQQQQQQLSSERVTSHNDSDVCILCDITPQWQWCMCHTMTVMYVSHNDSDVFMSHNDSDICVLCDITQWQWCMCLMWHYAMTVMYVSHNDSDVCVTQRQWCMCHTTTVMYVSYVTLRNDSDVCVTWSQWCMCHTMTVMYVSHDDSDVCVTRRQWCMCLMWHYTMTVMYVSHDDSDVCVTQWQWCMYHMMTVMYVSHSDSDVCVTQWQWCMCLMWHYTITVMCVSCVTLHSDNDVCVTQWQWCMCHMMTVMYVSCVTLHSDSDVCVTWWQWCVCHTMTVMYVSHNDSDVCILCDITQWQWCMCHVWHYTATLDSDVRVTRWQWCVCHTMTVMYVSCVTLHNDSDVCVTRWQWCVCLGQSLHAKRRIRFAKHYCRYFFISVNALLSVIYPFRRLMTQWHMPSVSVFRCFLHFSVQFVFKLGQNRRTGKTHNLT